jgi:inosine/xanthosine triphosphate pyrophosphatase family protein
VPPPTTTVVNRTPPPPAQPFSALSTFSYDAIFIPPKPGKQMASVLEGSTNRYNVTEGEYILGRYRINWIKETSMEIEDVDQNRRQTYQRQIK